MDISAFNKNAAKSFNQQKSLIKRVLSGKPVECPTCGNKLVVTPREQGLSLSCAKGCTDILLETN